MRLLIFLTLTAMPLLGQCGLIVVNPVTQLADCTGPAASASTVTATGTLTANKIVIGNGTTDIKASLCSVDSAGLLDCPGGADFGTASGKTGYTLFTGATSGSAGVTVADAAGTQILYMLPTTLGSTNDSLALDSGTTCPTMVAGAPSNCRQLKWATGSVGGLGFGPTIVAAPSVASLTWINQGTATATNADSLLTIQDVGNNGELRLLKRTATTVGSGFILTMWVLPTLPATQNTRVGIAMRESGTAKIQALFLVGGGATSGVGPIVTSDCWTNASTFSSSSNTLPLSVPSPSLGVWMRMVYDGTNVDSYLSGDGEYWYRTNTRVKTTCFTAAPNEVGVAVSPSNGSSVGVGMSVISWVEG